MSKSGKPHQRRKTRREHNIRRHRLEHTLIRAAHAYLRDLQRLRALRGIYLWPGSCVNLDRERALLNASRRALRTAMDALLLDAYNHGRNRERSARSASAALALRPQPLPPDACTLGTLQAVCGLTIAQRSSIMALIRRDRQRAVSDLLCGTTADGAPLISPAALLRTLISVRDIDLFLRAMRVGISIIP